MIIKEEIKSYEYLEFVNNINNEFLVITLKEKEIISKILNVLS